MALDAQYNASSSFLGSLHHASSSYSVRSTCHPCAIHPTTLLQDSNIHRPAGTLSFDLLLRVANRNFILTTAAKRLHSLPVLLSWTVLYFTFHPHPALQIRKSNTNQAHSMLVDSVYLLRVETVPQLLFHPLLHRRHNSIDHLNSKLIQELHILKLSEGDAVQEHSLLKYAVAATKATNGWNVILRR